MNGYRRHTKYRTEIYRRKQTKTVLLTAAAVLLLVFIALLILGSILMKRSKTDEPSIQEETQTVTEEGAELPSPPPLRATPVLLETSGSDTLASRLTRLANSGYTAASIPLNQADGALLYRSSLTAPLELTVAGEYSVTLESAVGRAEEMGIYLSGTYCLLGLEAEDDLVRSVNLSKSAAVVAEALRAGLDEVLLVPSSLTAEQIPALLHFADSVRALAPEGVLGCALPPSLLQESSAAESIKLLSEHFHVLALDLTQSGTDAPTEYVESTMATSGTLFYLLRYEMRILLPEMDEESARSALLELVEVNWTKNWQILSSESLTRGSEN